MLLFFAVLALNAYHGVSIASANTVVIEPLEFENDCVPCHVPPWPVVNWYCHDIMPVENYDSRIYLGEHIDWVLDELVIPTDTYLPLVTQPPQNEFQIHLFDGQLYPAAANITVGTKVTWTNLDIRDHTLLSQYAPPEGPFQSIVLKPGESVSYIFDGARVFTYTDKFTTFRPHEANLTGPGLARIYQSNYGKIVVSEKK